MTTSPEFYARFSKSYIAQIQGTKTRAASTSFEALVSQTNATPRMINGQAVLPSYIPSPPSLPAAPQLRHDINAPRVLDPATNTYAPRGYQSWAEHKEAMDAIKARNSAMFAHSQQVLAVLNQIDSYYAAPASSAPR